MTNATPFFHHLLYSLCNFCTPVSINRLSIICQVTKKEAEASLFGNPLGARSGFAA